MLFLLLLCATFDSSGTLHAAARSDDASIELDAIAATFQVVRPTRLPELITKEDRQQLATLVKKYALLSEECSKLDQITVLLLRGGGESLRPTASSRPYNFYMNGAICDNDALRVAVILEKGATLSAADKTGPDGPPLHAAAILGHVTITRMLLAADINVNEIHQNGNTPLHLAAKWNHGGVAELLLAAGANPHATNAYGETPFDCIRDSEWEDTTKIRELLRNAMTRRPAAAAAISSSE